MTIVVIRDANPGDTTVIRDANPGDTTVVEREATGRLFKFDVAKNTLDGLTTNLHPQSTVTDGDKLLVVPYVDGSTKLPYLYVLQHTRVEMLRMMLV